MSEPLNATAEQLLAAASVMEAVRAAISAEMRINLPRRLGSGDPHRFVSNPYGGVLGPFRYQLEGEDDLLHLIVARVDGNPLTAEQARLVAGELFKDVSTALVWLKPGEFSQHFYVGHDDLFDVGD